VYRELWRGEVASDDVASHPSHSVKVLPASLRPEGVAAA